MKMEVGFDVTVPMRDGVNLSANVYRHDRDELSPVLLCRLPYSKENIGIPNWLNPVAAVRQGFIVVIQDTRGRYASEGDWEPFVHEMNDGYDAVEWAARLPGSNGSVGMFGASYIGNTGWLAALANPPSLRAIAPGLTWADPHDGLFSRGGVVELGLAVNWAVETGFDLILRSNDQPDEKKRRMNALLDEYDDLPEAGYQRPLRGPGSVLDRHGLVDIGSLKDGGGDETPNADVTQQIDRASVPSFNIGGWHDQFLQGTLDNFEATRRRGLESRLVVGPWSHAAGAGGVVGDIDFGANADRVGAAAHANGTLQDEQLAWFRRTLDPGARNPDPEPAVRAFAMGRNRWHDHTSWPPPSVQTQRLFLRADRSLGSETPAPEEGATSFRHDPNDLVPTTGGPITMHPSFRQGPIDQRSVEGRADVCCFTSAPIQHDLWVAGRVGANIHSDAANLPYDLVVRLCDVDPDGLSINVCDGVQRVTSRSRQTRVDMWSTSHVFLAGHRMRVQIAASCFPRWEPLRTTNHVTIHHSSDRPSALDLEALEWGPV